jgi:hypothetical protein
MKKLMLLTALITGYVAVSSAQIREIPAAVTEAFKARYPHAEKVAWKDNITSFEARFMLNDFKMTAGFSSKGEWQSSEKTITFDQLPEEVKDGFSKSKYADRKKGSVIEIEKAEQPIQYRIFVKKSGVEKKYLYFDANGKLNREALTL